MLLSRVFVSLSNHHDWDEQHMVISSIEEVGKALSTLKSKRLLDRWNLRERNLLLWMSYEFWLKLLEDVWKFTEMILLENNKKILGLGYQLLIKCSQSSRYRKNAEKINFKCSNFSWISFRLTIALIVTLYTNYFRNLKLNWSFTEVMDTKEVTAAFNHRNWTLVVIFVQIYYSKNFASKCCW